MRARDVAILATAMAASLLHAMHFDHTADDAYIAFRYVDNFSAGRGLVFNEGEAVMGFSNPLWVMLLCALKLAGLPAPTAARVLGVLFAWATLLCVYHNTARRGDSIAPAIAALAFLVANGTYALWMFGGLEGHLFAFLLTSGALLAARVDSDASLGCYLRLGAVFGLAALTRPEGLLYAFPTAALLLVRSPNRARLLGVAAFCAVAGGCFLAQCGLAFLYYGDLLPNPAYAKYHPISAEVLGRGFAFTRGFLSAYSYAPLLPLILWFGTVRPLRRSPGWFAVGLIATFVAFFLRVGGDALVYHRMWLPVLPLLALLLAEALTAWRGLDIARGAVWPVTIAVVVLCLPRSLSGRDIVYLRSDEAQLRDIFVLARSLATLPGEPTVAANNVGILAYASDLPVLDMLGLNDAHIARAGNRRLGIAGHESHDGAYVLDRRPDLILFGFPKVFDTREGVKSMGPRYPSDHDLLEDPRFGAEYRLMNLRLLDGRYAPIFERIASAGSVP